MLWNDVLLCLTAVVAGVVNSVAGGGTVLTFPALFAVLGSSSEAAVIANVTSTVALWPASLSGAWGYRREFSGSRRWLRWLLAPSLIGGALGAWLLVWLPPGVFAILVPWLILTAALLFALQPQITRWTGIGRPHEQPSRAKMAGIAAMQFCVAIYGGYFGAGIGILMLSALALMGLSDIHRMNALKVLLGSAINGVAVAIFVAGGNVAWRYAWPMLVAATLGGYLGAAVARRSDQHVVRRLVVVIGFLLAGYYFYRQ
jgi:uncharacterized membrane protein YfcA